MERRLARARGHFPQQLLEPVTRRIGHAESMERHHHVEAVPAARPENLQGKVSIDVVNPVDAEHPGVLASCHLDSLGERRQGVLLETQVVTTLNAMRCGLIVNLRMTAGSHWNFISEDDGGAKSKLVELLETFGWRLDETVDLGEIMAARATEMLPPLWPRLWKSIGTAAFNFKIAR